MTRSATWIARVAVLVLLPLAACAPTERVAGTVATEGQAVMQAVTSPTLSTTDAYFMDKAARSSLAQLQEALLAVRAGTAGVRRFAARLLTEQRQLNTGLAALAREKRISPPTMPSDAQERMMSQLQGLTGASFDRAYLDQQVMLHQQAVRLYRTESQRGTDQDVKAFAAGALPALEQHLRMAEELGGRAPVS